MTNMLDKITCCKCGGEGEVDLPNELQETLDLLRRMKRGDAKKILQRGKWPVTTNAVSNRLSDLHDLELVRRERKGKFWIYYPLP